ncbi:MAG: dipeptidase [Phycisphaerales bacterium]|nr:dipeptidase [Phycisphaerales bacterium]
MPPAQSLPRVLDGHNDTLTRLLPRTGDAPQSIMDRGDAGHLDVPRARDGGLAGGFFALFIRPRPTEGADPTEPIRDERGAWTWTPGPIDHAWALQETARLLKGVDELFEQHPQSLRRCLCTDDIRASLADQRLGILLHIEGAEMLSPDCRELPDLYARGLRSIGPVWSRPNCFATGIRFGWPSSNDVGAGLTDAGRTLVRECENLGIAIDLSHMNLRGFMDVAEIATKPLIATHCGCHALCQSARNLTDDQLRIVAESGGVVGVNFFTGDLRGDGRSEPDMPLDRLADHVLHMIEVMGVEHVALGSDFDGATMCDELGDASGLPRLLQRLLDRGVSQSDLSAIAHENWLRVLDAHLS